MMFRFSYLVLIFAIMGYGVAFGQDDPDYSYDTAYIRDVSEKLAVRVLGINKFTRFSIYDKDLDQEIRYSPNSNLNFGFGVNYRWFGIGVAFNLPFINNDDDLYGKTTRFDAQTNVSTQKFLIDIYLHQYKGFYIENPESYIDDWDASENYPQRPDVSTSAIGGSFIYILNNKKYSAKAAYVQNQFQKKGAGSLLLGGFISFNAIQGDSSLIPAELSSVFNPKLLFYKVQTNIYGLAAGYTYNFVMWKKLYLSLTLVPGLAIQKYKVNYDEADQKEEGTKLSGRFLARTALVYNTERSFFGITASSDNFAGNSGISDYNSLNFEVGVVRFFYGRRFSIK